MDLNERLAARRKELAEEKDRVIREAAQQRQADIEATRQAAQAQAAAIPVLPDPMGVQTPAKKTVDLDLDGQVLGEAVERITKKQLAIFCIMAVLSLIGLSKDLLMAIFWAVCALGYIMVTIASHVQDIQKASEEK